MKAYRATAVAFIVLAASGAARADETPTTPRCQDVESIGVATMASDGTITMRIRSLPPGPIAEGEFVYKPGDHDYQSTISHLGGLTPGQSKPVKPWC